MHTTGVWERFPWPDDSPRRADSCAPRWATSIRRIPHANGWWRRGPLTLGERRLPSRLGLAAGMDKDAEAVLGMCALGYAFVEIGTVTPRPQPGNDAPRLWRLMEERGLRNRMGFNNAGADAAAEKLRELRSTPAGRAAIVGANIGKNKVTSEADAPADYEYCAKTLAHWVDFVVVNVSSPNTPGLRDLQSVDHLRPILQAARRGCEAGAPIAPCRSSSRSHPIWPTRTSPPSSS